jgi:fibronectin type 3 domain-containing protein
VDGKRLDRVEATLYYQSTSKEYVEFLRDENRSNDWGNVFYDLWAGNGKAAPQIMATAVWGNGGSEPDTEPPTAPTGLSATAVSSSEIALSWTASMDNIGVTSYTIHGATDGASVGTSDQTSFQVTGLQPSTTYAYYVTARDAAGNESDRSEPASATTRKQTGGGRPK